MAVWNVVRSSELSSEFILAPQYYQRIHYVNLEAITATGSYLKLGDCLREPLQRGIQPIYDEDADVPVINSQHIHLHELILGENNRRTTLHQKAGKGTVKRYDVLLNSTGDVTIGRAQVVLDNTRAVVDSHVTIIRTCASLDPVYLYVFLNSKPGRLQTERYCSGSSGQIELRKSAIENYIVWLPSDEFQSNIRQLILRAFDQRKQASDLYSQAESLLLAELGLGKVDLSHSLFYEARYSETVKTGRLDAEYFATDPLREWLSPYPTRALEKLVEKIENGLTPAASEYAEEGIPILKVGGLLDKGEISWLGDHVSTNSRINNTSKGRAKSKDVFVLCAAHHVRYIGKTGLLWGVPEGQVYRYVGELIGIRCSSEIRPEVLTVYLNLDPVLHSVQRLVRGLSAHLYPQDLATLPVPLLPDKVQDKISDMLGESHAARQESKRLIDKAVRLVEEAIYGTGR